MYLLTLADHNDFTLECLGMIIQSAFPNFVCCFIELPFLSGALLLSPEENCGEDILLGNITTITGMPSGDYKLADVAPAQPSIAPADDLSIFGQAGDDRDMIAVMIDESVEATDGLPNGH